MRTFERWRGRLESNPWLALGFDAGVSLSLHRQHAGVDDGRAGTSTLVVYGLFHTRDGYSKVVSSGDTIFTLIGFIGLYFVLGLLFLYLVGREIVTRPGDESRSTPSERAPSL